jgi:two-component system sensor histidine kinase AlgZ
MNAPPPAPAAADDEREFYLPDFCAAPAVLAIVVIATLLGCLLALSRQAAGHAFWIDLARTSALLLWIGLVCAAALCKARPHLARMRLARASAWALALIIGTVVLVAEATYWFGRYWEGRVGASSGFFPTDHWSFLWPTLCIALIAGALALRYFYVASQWRRSVELAAQARIRALQARIRPHFLFNSMNTIAALTRSDPARAEAAIEDLADLFRASLNEARTQITLREELEIAHLYERIEQLRLGSRLRVDWDVATIPADCVVPSLLLQPLLENAIGHGIEPLPGGGTVTVRGRIEGDMVVIEVANPAVPPPDRRPSRPGHQIALGNIRERLELAYPGQASVDVADQGDSYRVRLCFPRVGGRTDYAGAPPGRELVS